MKPQKDITTLLAEMVAADAAATEASRQINRALVRHLKNHSRMLNTDKLRPYLRKELGKDILLMRKLITRLAMAKRFYAKRKTPGGYLPIFSVKGKS